jgi:hypothetical protein
LEAVADAFPAWLDAIVSRESIVRFGKVMGEKPEELEFVQVEAHQFKSANGWMAFWASFKTRPSNVGMVVFGAYENEGNSHWASLHRNGPLAISLHQVYPLASGVKLMGTLTTDKGPETPFSAELGAAKVQMNQP